MKRSLFLKMVSILLVIVSIRGTLFVLTDNEFNYAGIPMPFVYIMLCIFILMTLYVFWSGFIKKQK